MVRPSSPSWPSAAIDSAGNTPLRSIRAAFGPNHARLVAVKSRYDPANFFRVNQNIVPGEPMAI